MSNHDEIREIVRNCALEKARLREENARLIEAISALKDSYEYHGFVPREGRCACAYMTGREGDPPGRVTLPTCPVHGESAEMAAHKAEVEQIREQLADRTQDQRIARAEVERLHSELGESRIALRWIASNADVPADWKGNQSVRLKQIHNRATEALEDTRPA